MADRSLDDVINPQIVLVPGGSGVDEVMKDPSVIQWIRTAHRDIAVYDGRLHGNARFRGGGAPERVEGNDPLELQAEAD